jgi:hypothetical protein
VIFSVVNSVLFKPLPVADPERLVCIWANSPSRNRAHVFAAYSTYAEWRVGTASFESMSAYTPASATLVVGDLAMARADGSLRSLLSRVSRINVLVIDDWAMAPLSEPKRRDFWEICENRYQVRSTILTSQLPVTRWHEQIGDPTLADGILDRRITMRIALRCVAIQCVKTAARPIHRTHHHAERKQP